MTATGSKARNKHCEGLKQIDVRDEWILACAAELNSPNMDAADKDIVEHVIRNTDPRRGRSGTTLAG
eukprot:483626-Pyramimonas_sp.AAC.1